MMRIALWAFFGVFVKCLEDSSHWKSSKIKSMKIMRYQLDGRAWASYSHVLNIRLDLWYDYPDKKSK